MFRSDSAARIDHPRSAEAIFNRIGNTPLVRLPRIEAGLGGGIELLAKLEWHNPSGSVKDRAASAIIQQAWKAGELEGERILLDSTSGNMGIAYATLAASYRIPLHLVIPQSAGIHQLAILRALGASLTFSDALEGSEGARQVASQMAATEPERFYYANQYSNRANWMAHFQTTGPEILAQSNAPITHFVAGTGTTGTLTGTGRYLKQAVPDIRVIGIQPDGPLHGLEGLKHLPSTGAPAIFDPLIPDAMIPVATEEAYAMARRLAREEGMLVGLSAAAAMVGACKVARQLEAARIVVLFPDSGEKYLNLPFWSAA